jgi:hypothetical protein
MGAKALDIAQKLRAKYELGHRDLRFDAFDMPKYYESELAKIEEAKARRIARDRG